MLPALAPHLDDNYYNIEVQLQLEADRLSLEDVTGPSPTKGALKLKLADSEKRADELVKMVDDLHTKNAAQVRYGIRFVVSGHVCKWNACCMDVGKI